MDIALAFPILGILAVIQSAVISRINLLHGSADLILVFLIAWAAQQRVKSAWHWCIIGGLMTSILSGLPFGALLIGYLISVGVAVLLCQRVWKTPVLALFLAVFVGTMTSHMIALITLRITGVELPLSEAINLVMLPSLILNLLFVLPAYALMGDLSKWLYREEIEV